MTAKLKFRTDCNTASKIEENLPVFTSGLNNIESVNFYKNVGNWYTIDTQIDRQETGIEFISKLMEWLRSCGFTNLIYVVDTCYC